MWFAYELLFRTKDDSWNRWYHLKDRAKVVNFNLQIGPEMVNLDKKDLPTQLLIRHESFLEDKMNSVINYSGTNFYNYN